MNDCNIRGETDGGVLVATIDMPGRSMNVFSKALMDSLEALMDRVAADGAVSACVITSGKDAFLAGADLEMIRAFTETARTADRDALHALCGRLGRLFRRLETHPKPFIAALNGLALGGGLELALACRERVVADGDAVRLGLPEVKLGLLPGAGGTQRLPRLIPVDAAARMLLTGEPVNPAQALALGLVDAVVPAGDLRAEALRRARAPQRHRARWDEPGARIPSAPFDFAAAEPLQSLFDAAGISAYQQSRYPAYRAIARCVAGAWNQPMDQAIAWEMDQFVDLIRDPVAGNMVRTLFLDRQRAAKAGLLAPTSRLAQGEPSFLAQIKQAQQSARAAQLPEDDELLAVSLAAIGAWSGIHEDVPAELADVAAVAAGAHPPFTGGPLHYARQFGEKRLLELAQARSSAHPALFALPGDTARFFARHASPP